ncbi:MAG: dodecin family protein [Paracoccaceae bacterium]
MAVARITEISAASKNSFDDAAKQGIKRATETLKNVQSAWIKDSEVTVKNGEVDEYRVHMKVTFVLDD